jgi:hypothetical protein
MLSFSVGSMQSKYKSAGNDWNDSKYRQLGEIVNECSSSIKKTLNDLNRCLVALDKIVQTVTEYESMSFTGGSGFDSLNPSIGVINNSFDTNIDSTTFCGILNDGTVVVLTNVSMKNITYTKRSRMDWDVLRKTFDSSIRRKFLAELGNQNDEYLTASGLTPDDILQIRSSRPSVPDGYEVHHILPLDDSGDNSIDNLILIRYRPHRIITNYQREFSPDLSPGDSVDVAWPMLNGMIYIEGGYLNE